MKRVFVIILDSLGIGEMPDAHKYKDEGSNTLRSLYNTGMLRIPCLSKMGIFNIENNNYSAIESDPTAAYARMTEVSNGKDTTVGHWEIMGLVSDKSFPTYPEGFPEEIINKFQLATGRRILCNKPYSGTQVILDYGPAHEKTGDLIVYTSSDSVFQIAAKEDLIPLEDLYEYCKTARGILVGEHAVGRVIARPFTGDYPNYTRTANRHDFSVAPPKMTALDYLKNCSLDVISVGKINDIFAGQGITRSIPTTSNRDGMEKTSQIANTDFEGLCFVNLVEFDSHYGHRNNSIGYTEALNEFDLWLSDFITRLRSDDILIITADHGCDPATESTDHSREYTPLLVYGNKVASTDLGTRTSFADTGKTVLDYFGIDNSIHGESYLSKIYRGGDQ